MRTDADVAVLCERQRFMRCSWSGMGCALGAMFVTKAGDEVESDDCVAVN